MDRWRWTVSRGTILFLVGLAGIAHETLIQDADRPTLLLLFAACLGLPAFLSGQDGGSKGGGPP